jgi:pimeloyl-ACP methyl ester carboxylesterase
VATVVGTPSIYQAPMPETVPTEELELTVFEDRVIPEVLWYQDTLNYSLVAQDHEAPLVFIIAGTGAAHDSAKAKLMAAAFYQAGFHSIALPSPTHPNFIVPASSTGVPGRISQDAPDLYRVMRLAYEQVADRIEVSEFHLTGYSLGAWQAAFVAQLDEQEKVFGFDKVLLVNPPVSLYSSIRILDDLLDKNIPGGVDHFSEFFDRALGSFYKVYNRGDFVKLDDEFLYRAWLETDPSEEALAALVGLSFRLSSTGMIFTADVMSDAGFLVPKGKLLTNSSPLTNYFKTGSRVHFEEYLDQLYLPFYMAKDPTLTREDLIREASMASIEDYLLSAQKIGLVTNEDDIILAPGEIDYLQGVFGARAHVFPTGGHMGNMKTPQFVAQMIEFFQG